MEEPKRREPLLSDSEIIARGLQGDTEAYSQWMERYERAIYGMHRASRSAC
jgi:hypothetical protein